MIIIIIKWINSKRPVTQKSGYWSHNPPFPKEKAIFQAEKVRESVEVGDGAEYYVHV